MPPHLMLSLAEGVSLAPGEAGDLVFRNGSGRRVVPQPTPGTFDTLADAAGEEERLAEAALRAGGVPEVARFYYHLRQLVEAGYLVRSSWAGGVPLATLVPTSPSFRHGGGDLDPARRYALSRFAFVRRDGGRMVLESPRAYARVLLHDWRATALVHALAVPGRPAEAGGRVPGLAAEAAEATLALLAAAGMLCAAGAGADGGDGADAAEGGGAALALWEFHDLLFHARSRQGRTPFPLGATYAGAGLGPPPAAVKAVAVGGPTVELPRPDQGRLQREDPPLARVMEQRHSERVYGREPLTLAQLGEFLYRVARVRECREAVLPAPGGDLVMALTSRPYPSGGGLYELEFYAAVQACAGLPAGLYTVAGGEPVGGEYKWNR